MAGLPNITGYCGISRDFNPTGAFYTTGQTNTTRDNGNNWTTRDGHFNAHRCSSVYGSSTTVTPLSLTTKIVLKY